MSTPFRGRVQRLEGAGWYLEGNALEAHHSWSERQGSKVGCMVSLVVAFSASALDARNQFGRADAECIAKAKQGVEGRRFVIVFELAEVTAVDPGIERKLLLAFSR